MSVTRIDFDDDVYEVKITSYNEFGGEATTYFRRVNGKLVRVSHSDYDSSDSVYDILTMEK